jgi:bacterioferritin
MAERGNSIINGIEVEEVVRLLNKAYADEWLAYYQYYVEERVVKGIMKDAVAAELRQHAADELRHADMLSGRILQLGGTPLLDPKEWLSYTNCGYKAPEEFNVVTILEDAIKGEQCAISTYSLLLDLTREKDVVTYDLISGILADEVEHEEDLQALHDDITEFVDQIKSTVS